MPRFNVRVLLLLMVLVALATTIIVQRQQMEEQRWSMFQEIARKDQQLRAAEKKLNGTMTEPYKEVSPWNGVEVTVYPEGYWGATAGKAQLAREQKEAEAEWAKHPAKSKDKKVRDAYWAQEGLY
jgi:hypothetical protein